jgi:hypothetical protein
MTTNKCKRLFHYRYTILVYIGIVLLLNINEENRRSVFQNRLSRKTLESYTDETTRRIISVNKELRQCYCSEEKDKAGEGTCRMYGKDKKWVQNFVINLLKPSGNFTYHQV